MKLLKQVISRNCIKFEEGLVNDKKYVQNFYIAFCLAYSELASMNLIKIDENLIKQRNSLIKYINFNLMLRAVEKGGDFKKNYNVISDKWQRLLQDTIRSDFSVINKFNDVFQQIKIDNEEFGDLYKVGSFGIIEFEFADD